MALPRQIDLNMHEVQNLMNLKSASVNRQVNYVFDKMTYYGQSRHHAKNEARTLGAKTSSDVSKLTGIYGIRTRASYQKYCAEFLRYCRNPKNFDMENGNALKPERNILNLTDEHVRQFLVARSKTVSRASMGTVGSALNKFEAGLRRIDGLNRSWRSIIQDVKTQCQKKEYSQRGYEHPLDIVNNLSGEYRVLAELQLFNGLRIGEMYKFSMANLVGNSLHLTNTKGGKARLTIKLPPDTKREVTIQHPKRHPRQP